MTVRLGVNPIAWSNDDMRTLGGDTPLETCLAEARAAGFAGIELGHKFPRDPDLLRAVLSDHGLQLVSGWYSTGLLRHGVDEEWVAIQDHANLLRALGCEIIILAETTGAVHGDISIPLQRSPTVDGADMTRLATRLTELSGRLTDLGLRSAYHHHMGTVVETADEIERLMTASGPELGLLLDTGHAVFAGVDPLDLARRHHERITHVHCKDVRADRLSQARKMSFLSAVIDGVFTVPGDGAIDYPPILEVLADTHYDGWMVIEAEQDPEKADPAAHAILGFDNLARMARDANLI